MQPLKARMVLFGALAGLACHGEPTGNEGTPTSIIAKPEVVFISQGASEAVIVTVVDEDGQALQADFTTSNVGAGITVVEDTTFLQVTSANQIRRQARFFVTGGDLTASPSSFVVSALGVSDTIQVTSVPATLAATFSDTLPALGDTISITAAPGTFFTAASAVTFEGALPFIVSQDASTIVFIPFPNIDGPASVSEVGVTSNPDLTFTLVTTTSVRTDTIVDIGAAVSNPAPALGEAITLTLPAGLRVIPESLPSVTVAGVDVAPINITASLDSSTITFTPPPNADSFVVVPGVIPVRLAQCCTATRIIGTDTIPGYGLLLPTTARVTTPVVTVVPSTVSDAAPDVNEVVTLTSTDAAYTFSAASGVTVGAIPGAVSGVGAGGSSLTFQAPPGATGPITVSGVGLAGFSLTLPSSAPPITVSSVIPTIAGTDDPGTAPSLITPFEGGASLLFDKPAYDNAARIDAFYELVVTQAGVYTVTVNWDIGTDIDLFLCPSPGAITASCDFRGATAAHPEVVAYTLAPGTHYVVVEDFGTFTAPGPPVPDAAGTTLSIRVAHAPPPPPGVRAATARTSSVRKVHR